MSICRWKAAAAACFASGIMALSLAACGGGNEEAPPPAPAAASVVRSTEYGQVEGVASADGPKPVRGIAGTLRSPVPW